MPELRECPFCGNKVAIETNYSSYDQNRHSHNMVIKCNCCDFEFPRNGFKISAIWDRINYEYIIDKSEYDETVEKWNKRFIEEVWVE